MECYNCGKKGHMKADCWAKGGGKEGQKPAWKGKAKNSANAAATSADDKGVWTLIDDTEDLSVVEAGLWTDNDDKYLLEGAATFADCTTPDVTSVTSTVVMAAGDGLTKRGVESDLYDSGATRHMSPF